MNTKRLPEMIMVACLIVLAAWWWWPVKPVPVKPTVVQFRPPPPPEEAPVQPVTPTLPVATVDPPAPAAVDPQADLSTAIPDFIRLFQSGDFATLVQNYVQPEDLVGVSEEEKASFIKELQSPAMQQDVWELQAVQFMPPVYNADKTRATFTPPDGSSTIVFVNENGRWYRD